VIGYDAAGVVVEAGPQASLFRPGDEAFYAGSNMLVPDNALVDEMKLSVGARTRLPIHRQLLASRRKSDS